MTRIACFFLALALAQPSLALSTTEAMPGQTIEATAVGEGLELRAPEGFSVSAPWTEAGVTHWRIQITTAKPSLQPYRIELWQGGRLVDVVGLRVCCSTWPAALRQRAWLPFVQ